MQTKLANDAEPPLRVTDPEKIRDRIQSLPKEVREVIDEKFRGEYFAIERIDQQIDLVHKGAESQSSKSKIGSNSSLCIQPLLEPDKLLARYHFSPFGLL